MQTNTWRSLLKIFLGNAILGFAYAKLLVPMKIINGGVTSLSMVFSHFLPLPVTFFTNTLTVLLLLTGLIFLGKYFFFTSLVSSVAYLLFFNVFYALPWQFHSSVIIQFISAVFLIAVGYYCCLSEDSSTAGLDVFAIILNRKMPNISTAHYLRYLNIVVLIFGFVSYGVQSVLIGILFSICFTQVVGVLLKHKERKDKPATSEL